MSDVTLDDKQSVILTAAWAAFACYGYRKTSMDDIAKGAGMSRPALYMHFKNKEDILRSLVAKYFDQAAIAVTDALSSDGSVAMRLLRAFQAQGGILMETMLTSPHGMELLETSTGAALDLVETGEDRLQAIYADWLAAEMSEGRVDLRKSPDHVAATLTGALKGLKKSCTNFDVYMARLETLAILMGKGLSTRPD